MDAEKTPQQQVVDLLLEQDDVAWKQILYDLVKSEQMDPWNIDITLLTRKYIQIIKDLKENNLRISGKVLLAAAFLLKIKSTHLVDHDISNLDRLLNQTEEMIDEEELFSDLANAKKDRQHFQLIPRNPQPRSRKVSINDLVEALQRAMASKRRILAKQRPVKFIMPKRGVDIVEIIRDIYHKIVYYTDKDQQEKLSFTKLLPPRAGRREKVFTFIPLLHLENEDRITTEQEHAFGEIYVKLMGKEKA